MSDDRERRRERQRESERLCRARQRDGQIRLCIWCDEVELIAVLRLAGFIGEGEADPEGEQLARVLEHVVRLWIAPPE
jgi:hypothetical protein